VTVAPVAPMILAWETVAMQMQEEPQQEPALGTSPHHDGGLLQPKEGRAL
jgi:hypothetical protein